MKFGRKLRQFFSFKFLQLLIKKGALWAPFFVSFFSLSIYAGNWKSKEWLYLNAYRETHHDHFVSEFDDQKYFLAKDGKINPREELNETIKLLGKGEKFCEYPARVLLLKKWGVPVKGSLKDCQEFQFFLSQVDLKNLWMVFASYYINNPGSSFGHTFLRFESSDKSKNSDLIDFSLDYSANVPEGENSIVYTTMGLAGGYKATYKLLPYYWKIREYVDGESRDLWEYQIKLTDDEKLYLLAHIWELRNIENQYFFFNENCSYHILALLQAVLPHKKILEKLHKIVIPIDTLFALEDNDLIEKSRFRPSMFTQLETSMKGLDDDQRKDLKSIIENPSKIYDIEDEKVFDTYITYYDFKNYKDLLEKESSASKEKNRILLKRLKLKIASSEKKYFQASDPLSGHRSRRVRIGFDSEDYVLLEYKAALQQLVDPSMGYAKNYHMDMGEASFRIKNDDFIIERLKLLKIVSLKPLSFINKGVSWNLQTLLQRDFRDDRLKGEFHFGSGVSIENKWGLGYLHLHSYIQNERGFLKELEGGLGPGILYSKEINRFRFEGTFRFLRLLRLEDDLLSLKLSANYKIKKDLSLLFSFKNNSISNYKDEGILAGSLNYYF